MNDLQPGGGRLYVLNADGSGVRVILDNYRPAGLAWSPDGQTLAYATHGSSGDEDADHLWTISAVGGAPTTLAASTVIAFPVWSPDSSQIAFVGRTEGGLRGWYAVDAGGTGPQREIDELTYVNWGGWPFAA
jgi:Tol biopolymer transport system component